MKSFDLIIRICFNLQKRLHWKQFGWCYGRTRSKQLVDFARREGLAHGLSSAIFSTTSFLHFGIVGKGCLKSIQFLEKKFVLKNNF